MSLPPKTQPVSMLTVRLSHSGSGTGVWPYTTIAEPRYSAAQLWRTGRPNSSVSPVVSPYRAKSRTLPEPRPCISAFMPAWATTSLPSSRT